MTVSNQSSDFPPNPVERPGYRLEFVDEFRSPVLDTGKWLPFYLPQWSSRRLAAARYSLPGDCLQLHIEADQSPWCPDYDGALRVSSLQTGCFSGPAGSGVGQHKFTPALVVAEPQPCVRHYTPRYGYFEIRLKAVPIPGYMVALWMIGFEEQPQHSGEICICEIFGRDLSASRSGIGFGIHPFSDPLLTDDFRREVMAINSADYHIYAAEWTPTHVEFFVDNQATGRIRQSPDYPMQLMLGLYELPGQLTGAPGSDLWPKTLSVDYVRGYQPLGGYRQSGEV